MLFYEFALGLYAAGIRLASVKSDKAGKWIRGRHDWRSQMQGLVTAEASAKRIWIHAASLGEFEQVRPLVDHYAKDDGVELIVTFFSPSGYEVRKNYPGLEAVYYLPLDTARNAHDFVDILRPDLALFVKYEVWLNYLAVLREKGIPTALVSALFRQEQRFFTWWGGAFRKALKGLDSVFVQNDESLQLAQSIGVEKVFLQGDLRFDQVYRTAQEAESIERIERFKGEDNLLVIGSAWEPELELLEFISLPKAGWKVLIAPHEIGSDKIDAIQTNFPESSLFTDASEAGGRNVMILDTVGYLSRAYRYADIAVVGGGLGTGLHNILEPAAFGVPVLFGDQHEKFPEACQLIAAGGGADFSLPELGAKQVEQLMDDIQKRKQMGANAAEFVKSRRGATELLLNYISKKLG